MGISLIDLPLRAFTSTRPRQVCFRAMLYRIGLREACETDSCEFGLRADGLRIHARFVSMAWDRSVALFAYGTINRYDFTA